MSKHVRPTRGCKAICAIALIGIIGAAQAMVMAPPAAAATTPPPPRKAMILDTSVSGGLDSNEAKQAVLEGFAVTVATAAQWSAMTTAQFRTYSVLILGDPNCGGRKAFAAAEKTASIWEAAVLASGGNRVIIGTDPTFHFRPGAAQLERSGIAFAGATAGATGAYADLTCAYNAAAPNSPVTWLNGLSSAPRSSPSAFTVEGVPCGGAISIVALSGPTAKLKDSDLSDWHCSVHEAFDRFPADFTPLAIATDSTVKSYKAKDVETGVLKSGAPYIMIAGTGVSVSSNITLTPTVAHKIVGERHSVTAKVVDGSGKALPGVTVAFQVVSGPNVGKALSAATNPSGQAVFSYLGSAGPGDDGLSASFTDTSGALQKATATVNWAVTTVRATSLALTAPAGADFHDVVKVSATLTAGGSGPSAVAGKSVAFSLVGSSGACTAVTSAKGIAGCSFSISALPGVNTLTATFAGDSSFTRSTVSRAFSVLKEATALVATTPATASDGGALTLSGVLSEDAGGPKISGRPVSLGIGTGRTAQTCAGTTDAAGAASCVIAKVVQAGGDVPLTLSFNGDSSYLPTALRSAVHIKVPTKLTADVAVADVSASPAVSSALRATLLDVFGKPIAGKLVVFSSTGLFGSGTGASELCRAITDASGVATCGVVTGQARAAIAFGYNAAFGGLDPYLPSSAKAPVAKVNGTPVP